MFCVVLYARGGCFHLKSVYCGLGYVTDLTRQILWWYLSKDTYKYKCTYYHHICVCTCRVDNDRNMVWWKHINGNAIWVIHEKVSVVLYRVSQSPKRMHNKSVPKKSRLVWGLLSLSPFSADWLQYWILNCYKVYRIRRRMVNFRSHLKDWNPRLYIFVQNP